MGHVFRINKSDGHNAPTTIVDWNTSSATPYNNGYVDEIADTTTTQKEITSIPSPFARIELVKEAFNKVVPKTISGMTVGEVAQAIQGQTIYHKMVSDTLDVAQLFFSYPSMEDKLEIVVWQRDREIQQLLGSSSKSHNIIGKTLDMFLEQDALGADPYNFSKLKNLYILKYKGFGQSQMHIIGSTSPATLFFSTANDESRISKQLCFGTDFAFDTTYASLDKRDPEFIKYLFAFRYSNPNFNKDYPEVARYLDAIYYILDNNLKNVINGIQNSCQAVVPGNKSYVDSNYDLLDISVNATTNYQVEINGVSFHCKKPIVAGNSDFEINPKVNVEIHPLVLPVVSSSKYENLTYLGCQYGRNFSVPNYDSNNLMNRRLPGINIQHPYLTISDFLEDKIVKLPSNINNKEFFDGNYSSNNGQKEGFLIPVTSLFFDYFTIEDLMGIAPSGKNTIDIKSVASGVEVTLRIPIQNGNEVEYKRIYCLDVKSDKVNNKGAIVLPPEDFAVGVFPPVKFAQEYDAHYRIVLVGYYNVNKNFMCECHGADGFFKPDYVVRNIDIEDDDRSKVYCIEGKTFDCARITISTDRGKERIGAGLMIPKFKKRTGSGALTFAIDLGTSNTHIEYSEGSNTLPVPFEYDQDQPQMSLLFTPDEIVLNHIRGEFVPESIGKDRICQFPMRTVLCIDKINSGINETGNGTYVAFGNASPAFMYNKSVVGPRYNDFVPNLKWSQVNTDNEERIRCYIESLFMMIRTKVIQLGASLSQTQIKWFYPISMSPIKLGLFQRVWTNSYQKYFNPTGTPVAITESVAPFSFFQKTRADVSDIVTIDIGGGTTDIVVADSNGVKCVSSMRFAADAIFGNTLISIQDGKLNGIIRQFKDVFISNLEGTELKKMLQDSTAGNLGNSTEVASFLFSLADNDEIKRVNLSEKVNFNTMLMRDDKQKIVFFIFYTAIIYHLAKLMRAKQLKVPSNIAFSGNGSKVVSVLSPNTKSLENLTTTIFKLIYNDVDIEKIKLIINSKNPKEATCKGGLFLDHEPDNIEEVKTILLSNKLVDNETYKNADSLYDEVEDEVHNYADFIGLKLAQNKFISLSGDFGIDKSYLEMAIDCFNGDIRTYIQKGVTSKLNSGDVGIEDRIEETLFFYPIIGVMNDLSDRICNL